MVGENFEIYLSQIAKNTLKYLSFFIIWIFSSRKRSTSHGSAEKLSRNHGKPEFYKKTTKNNILSYTIQEN